MYDLYGYFEEFMFVLAIPCIIEHAITIYDASRRTHSDRFAYYFLFSPSLPITREL
jgi:hypothetical protein